MHRLRFLWTVSILMVLVMSVSPALAQSRTDRDGDGVSNDLDNCPDDPGPPENRGCPVRANPGGHEALPVWDGDGDGLTDDIDFCPRDPGPAENGGCPLPEPAEEPAPAVPLPPLPEIPADGSCMIATQSHTGVNIRLGPSTTSEIVDGMPTYELYPVAYQYNNSVGETWYAVPDGFVAGWVTRTGGQCQGLPVFSVIEDHEGEMAIMLQTSLAVSLSATVETAPPKPIPFGASPSDVSVLVFVPDAFPFPEMPPDPLGQEAMPPDPLGRVLLAQFSPDGGESAVISTGLLLPAIQHAQDTAWDTGETQLVVLMAAGSQGPLSSRPTPADPTVYRAGDLGWSWAAFAPLDAYVNEFGWLADDENWGYLISADWSNGPPSEQTGLAVVVVIKAAPEAEVSSVPVGLIVQHWQGGPPEVCDSTTLPTTETACLYTTAQFQSAGSTALCMAAADGSITCLYGTSLLSAGGGEADD